MADEVATVDCGIRLSTDGNALALDWMQPEGKVTTIWPTAGVPTLIGMLLGAAQASAGRQAASPSSSRPSLDRVFQPTDMQLIAPSDGSDWILRILFGNVSLDFAVARQHATQLQKAIAGSPQAQFPMTKPDA